MILCMCYLPAFGNSYTQDDKLINVDVSYTTQGIEEYTVVVPAELNPGQSGTVSAYGKWASNRKLVVSADNSVVLTNKFNPSNTITLDITFSGIQKIGNNSAAIQPTDDGAFSTISVSNFEVLFGTWTGRVNYTVGMQDA